jgi:formyl-CoA transferase
MSGQMPLKGLRVLDFASFIAGPVATTVMGDYGAEVIKIEPPGEGDPQRKLGQAHSVLQHPVNFCWHMTNRNKKAMVIDLKSPQGRTVFERLLPTADVMVVNFPLKVRARLGMRYADVATEPAADLCLDDGLRRARPRCRPTGLRFDRLLRPLRPARRAHLRGRPARRERTGEGSEVSSSLYASGLWSNGLLAQGALLGAYVAPRPPRTKPRSALANQYRTADGRWIQLTIVREDKLWPELRQALECLDLLEDSRFTTTESRRAHAAQLAAILDPIFAAHPWPEWRKRLRHHEITFGLLGVLRDVPHDHQAIANGAVVESHLSEVPQTISAPIRLSFAEPQKPGAGPQPGEHTEALMSALGYSAAEIAALKAAGAVA